MEDLDPPREVAGAADDILRTLASFGLHWDGPVIYQGKRHALYDAALERLVQLGLLYGCACTRSEIADSSPGGQQHIYPGTCRNGLPAGRAARALRVRVNNHDVRIDDRLQGEIRQQLELETGDFILRRADGLHAYQLAVVVDDAEQGITDIVRGADLLFSTPRQRYLQQLLGLHEPRYLHLPIAITAQQEKLGKQTNAPAVIADNGNRVLIAALSFLRQPLPEQATYASQEELLQWATKNWDIAALPRQRELEVPVIPGV